MINKNLFSAVGGLSNENNIMVPLGARHSPSENYIKSKKELGKSLMVEDNTHDSKALNKSSK